MANFSDPTTLALLGASAGFLDPRGGMIGGFQGALQGMQAGNDLIQQKMQSDMMQQKALQQIDAQRFLQSHQRQGTNPRDLVGQMVMSGNPMLMQYAGNLAKSLPKAKFNKVLNAQGQQVYQPMFDTGEFGEVGTNVAPERLMQSDLGGQQVFVDPLTGRPVNALGKSMAPGEQARLAQGYAQMNQSQDQFNQAQGLAQQRLAMQMDPEFQAAMAATKQKALNRVQANIDLPRVIDKASESIDLIDSLTSHPGFKISVGGSAPIGKLQSMVPGTPASDFARRMEQIQGQQFLQAFETLKGGGQITEREGEKATQAISRMNTAQSEKEFIDAANEFKGIIQKGVTRAKNAAGVQPSQNTSGASGSFSDGWGELK